MTNFIRHCIAVLCLFVLSFSVINVTEAMGLTPASFKVSPSGAATYKISINVPPGTAGMAPNISLEYNSQSGNGLFGQGWSLKGLPIVRRCAATIAQDGFKGGINYDANDRFCLIWPAVDCDQWSGWW